MMHGQKNIKLEMYSCVVCSRNINHHHIHT